MRSAVLNGYTDLVRSLGLDPLPLLAESGIDVADLAAHNRWIPVGSVAALLEASAAATAREDFGLLVAQRRRMSNLGPIALVAREEPDVRSALDVLIRFEHLHIEGLPTRLREDSGLATLELSLRLGQAIETRQSIEMAVGVATRIIRGLVGREWHPLSVCFTHTAPREIATHARVLGPSVHFDRSFNGIVFFADVLDEPNTAADAHLRPYVREYLESLARPPTASDAEVVRDVVEALLPTGRCTLEQVARTLAMDRKTVHRRLSATGMTFSAILTATRVDLVQQYLGRQDRTFTETASLLGFSSTSTFSRWFHDQYGVSPTAWRAARRLTAGSPGSR